MFSVKKLLKMTEIHNSEYQRSIDAHRESHDPENPRGLIDTYITRMNEELKVNPDTKFSGKILMFDTLRCTYGRTVARSTCVDIPWLGYRGMCNNDDPMIVVWYLYIYWPYCGSTSGFIHIKYIQS